MRMRFTRWQLYYNISPVSIHCQPDSNASFEKYFAFSKAINDVASAGIQIRGTRRMQLLLRIFTKWALVDWLNNPLECVTAAVCHKLLSEQRMPLLGIKMSFEINRLTRFIEFPNAYNAPTHKPHFPLTISEIISLPMTGPMDFAVF